MVDLQLIGYTAIGVAILAAIALIGSHFNAIVSTVSGEWNRTIERARRQKASRERLYGYAAEPVLGSNRTSSDAGSSGSRYPVPGQQNQLEPGEPGDGEPFARQLAKEELIILLAVQRNADGGYLYSANQITTFVGGTAAPIKATIANVRGKKEQPAPLRSLQRPMNGW
jgi:hypothetical protein